MTDLSAAIIEIMNGNCECAKYVVQHEEIKKYRGLQKEARKILNKEAQKLLKGRG
jgi:ferritin-like metal-binding protein YciE